MPPTVEEVAQHFPGFAILELLGRGGMGAVYKARQKQLDRLVALQILPPRIGDGSAFSDPFTREARALKRLNHPGIVTRYEVGAVKGTAGSPLPAAGELSDQRRAAECALPGVAAPSGSAANQASEPLPGAPGAGLGPAVQEASGTGRVPEW